MTPLELLSIVKRFPTVQVIANRIDPPRGYDSHKDHWIGWLSEYHTEGAYGRRHFDRDAQFCYEHLQNAGMLIWINEAARLDVRRAFDRYWGVRQSRPATQCRVIRAALPWTALAPRLARPRG